MAKRSSKWWMAAILSAALSAPAAAQQAAAATDEPAAPRRTVIVPAAPYDSPAEEPDPQRALDAALASARDEAPPSAADFAYQVLMIAVSAIVTALVWKAIN